MAEEFTIAPVRRLLKRAGDFRVNPDAAEAMRRSIGEYGARLAELAGENATREGRKTILERDIEAAIIQVWRTGEKRAE